MKITIMGNDMGFGGAQTAYRELATHLQEAGHRLSCVSVRDRKQGHAKFAGRELGPVWPRSSSRLDAAIKTRDFVQVLGKAILRADDVLIAVGLSRFACRFARFNPRFKYSVALDFIDGRASSDPLLLDSLNSFSCVATQTPSMAEKLKSKLPPNSNIVYLPCLGEPIFDRVRCEPRPHPHGRVSIAYFGRLAENKGLVPFLSATAALLEAHDVGVDIWGGGECQAELLECIADRGLGARVALRGPFPGGLDGARLMVGYDAIVLPTLGAEGLPLTLVNAMAYGLPLLTTNVGAIPWAVGGSPDVILVEPDRASFESGILRLVHGIKARAFSRKRQIEYYETKLSRRVMETRWREFMSELAQQLGA